jgi:hypothetical protein
MKKYSFLLIFAISSALTANAQQAFFNPLKFWNEHFMDQGTGKDFAAAIADCDYQKPVQPIHATYNNYAQVYNPIGFIHDIQNNVKKGIIKPMDVGEGLELIDNFIKGEVRMDHPNPQDKQTNMREVYFVVSAKDVTYIIMACNLPNGKWITFAIEEQDEQKLAAIPSSMIQKAAAIWGSNVKIFSAI